MPRFFQGPLDTESHAIHRNLFALPSGAAVPTGTQLTDQPDDSHHLSCLTKQSCYELTSPWSTLSEQLTMLSQATFDSSARSPTITMHDGASTCASGLFSLDSKVPSAGRPPSDKGTNLVSVVGIHREPGHRAEHCD